MTIYETIFKRRAVRSYDMKPLDKAVLSDIEQFVANTKQLDKQNARFEILSADEVNDKHAPHYIAAYCDKNDAAYINVGYVLEKTDLYIQGLGLGSIFLGRAKPKNCADGFCILLAFGKSDEPMRNSIDEFKRLPLSKISGKDCDIAKAIRLAPSAINLQPWKIRFENDKVIINYVPRGFLKIIHSKEFGY